MNIEPWMLVAYMVGGMCFFLFIAIKVMPHFARKNILNGLASKEGKAIMRQMLLTALESLEEEIEIPTGPAGPDGKVPVKTTTLGAHIVGMFAASITQHIRMSLLGERGNLSMELARAEGDMVSAALPANIAPFAGVLGPLLKKYPFIGSLIQAFIASKMSSPSTPTNASGYRGL